MTYEEALELFGLSRIPSEAVLKILRNDAVKAAVEQKNEDRQKDINAAFAVLIGKEDAEIAVGQGAESAAGPTGFVKAVCREHKDKAFVLEWQKMPADMQNNVDKVMMSNPQRLEWDSNVDGLYALIRWANAIITMIKNIAKQMGAPLMQRLGAGLLVLRQKYNSLHTPPALHVMRRICNGVRAVIRSFVTRPAMITKTSLIRALIAKTHMVGVLAIARRLRKSLMGNIFALLPQKNVNL